MAASRDRADITRTIEIQNVVASSTVDQELDLNRVANDLAGADYDHAHFPGIIYRSHSKGTALLFRSGRIVAAGANSVDDAHAVIYHFVTQLHALGITVPAGLPVTVENIVANADLGYRLDLNAVAIGLGLEHVEYEPEQFPGLVYRVDDPAVVVLVFGSGKVVLAGANQLQAVERALKTVADRLAELGLLESG